MHSVAQARTGTGKTLGFLIPTIQNILRKNPDLAERKRYSRARASDIRAIIVSPTRELAEQIGVEAEKLCANTDLRVQVATGGNSKRAMLQKTQREGCHLLVATPGRLKDLLSDPYNGVQAPNLTTLVLDEADRLLDDGFSRDIEEIQQLLPRRTEVDRQTLLFSATMPREVMHLVRRTLKPDMHFVQAVREDDVATHDKVPQKIVTVVGIENFMPTLLELCKREVEKAARDAAAGQPSRPFKAIVYFKATAQVELAYRIFDNLRADGTGMFGKHPLYPADVSCIHGKLTQEQRTRISQRFRTAKSAVLMSTDVTARGMDFPKVTHVIQVGSIPNREQYIHRLGRTGRGDEVGEGWLIINDAEVSDAKRQLRGLPLIPDKTLESSQVDMTKDAQLPKFVADTLQEVANATKMVDRQTKVAAYMGSLGGIAPNNVEGFQALNQWTRYGWGWETPPAVAPGLASKLGLNRVRGMNVEARKPREYGSEGEDRGGFSSGGRGGRGGFGGRDSGRSGGFSSGGRDGGRPSYGGDRGSYGGRGGFGGRDGGRDGGRPSYGGNSRGNSSYGGRGDRPSYGGRDAGRDTF